MSHFTVLLIGSDPETQLKPFYENLDVEYKDNTDEYKKEYETKMASEFVCSSCSSWGIEITKELFDTLKSSKVESTIDYVLTKIEPMSYFKLGGKYRSYYTLEDRQRCEGSQWFEVEKILETTHPDETTCFEGKIRIRNISPPKKMRLKDMYPSYKDYLKQWHGIENGEKQGYYFNPNAKWDWYKLGGRWGGFFKLKPNAIGKVGSPGIMRDDPKFGTADQALKKDIDFDGMSHDQFEESSENYDKFEKEYKESLEGKPSTSHWYLDFGIENTSGNRDIYVPETREQFLKRRAPVCTFAVLKDGVWYERGEMGWWGMVGNEKDPDEWNNQFKKLFDELPEDTLLSVYDCHI